MSDVTVFVTRYTGACNGVSNALVTLPPTRPVPTRPVPSFINYPRRDQIQNVTYVTRGLRDDLDLENLR